MGRPGPQTFAKRQRELKKREKREAKAAKMARRKELKKAGVSLADQIAEQHPNEPHPDEALHTEP